VIKEKALAMKMVRQEKRKAAASHRTPEYLAVFPKRKFATNKNLVKKDFQQRNLAWRS